MFKLRFGVRAAGLLLLAGMAVPLAGPVPAYAASVVHTYLQFNMCGNACNSGGLDVANDVVASVNSRSPFVVTLNEVCRNQYSHIWATLIPYYGKFETTVPGACANGADYGNAILLRTSSFTDLAPTGWTLPNPGGNETRKLSCLRTSATGGGTQPLVACVTHIDYHDANLAQQVASVASTTRALWSGNHVLVGGDFNIRPTDPRLNPMYAPGYSPAGTGVFNEADAPSSLSRSGGGAGSATNEYTGQCFSRPCGTTWLPRAKIDYMFLSRLDFSGYSADATYAGRSDHTPLWATATYV